MTRSTTKPVKDIKTQFVEGWEIEHLLVTAHELTNAILNRVPAVFDTAPIGFVFTNVVRARPSPFSSITTVHVRFSINQAK